jgi:hypothetical protein
MDFRILNFSACKGYIILLIRIKGVKCVQLPTFTTRNLTLITIEFVITCDYLLFATIFYNFYN